MSHPSSGLGYLPLPFHHPGWRSSPHYDFFSRKNSSPGLYGPGRKDQDSSCLEVEADKFSPSCQEEDPLHELERKESVLFIRQSRTPKATFRPVSLPKLSLTTCPKQVSGQSSSTAEGNLSRSSFPPSPSYFADGRNCEVSVRLKPDYRPRPVGSKREDGDKEEEKADKKDGLQKSFSTLDETSPENLGEEVMLEQTFPESRTKELEQPS
ncbi:PREDICTED: homeobox protein Hox-B9 isoform X2 [Thamnophis sirtalis]|uniref:Homeobox protein Hox-B9 isoform X2 n=1 Tax=Thamnophis sirtalis TaxID=35019 RepID=A0A6I9Y2V6_9SAUR|nr:PREDICTED: homeobox protein Hox-B9 isoform X2 [Thamnophis sirtalis]